MKSVRDVLRGGEGGVLQALTAKSARREALDALLDDFLDTPFRSHVQVASLTDGVLILCADNPTWGHRIRYLAPDILEHFSSRGVEGLVEVTISVRAPGSEPTTPRPSVAPGVSARSASVLEAAAANLDNAQLARKLRAIARYRDE